MNPFAHFEDQFGHLQLSDNDAALHVFLAGWNSAMLEMMQRVNKMPFGDDTRASFAVYFQSQMINVDAIEKPAQQEPYPLEEMQKEILRLSEIISTNAFYQAGHANALEWAAEMAALEDPRTSDWVYDDPHELAKALRKGPDFPSSQQPAQEEIDWKDQYEKQKRRADMWVAKYEADIGPLEKAGPVTAQQEPVAFSELAKRRVFDYIRGAYDLGYSDARNARSIPGDSAPGYKGRDVEADHGGALLHSLQALYTRPQAREPEQPAQQEPVALLNVIRAEPTEMIHKWRVIDIIQSSPPQGIYYTPPAQRKPLKPLEIENLRDEHLYSVQGVIQGHEAFTRAIEAAHGIKENT